MNTQNFAAFSPLLNSDIPLYMQIYTYYKALITSGKLPPNRKLPSIRRCAESLSVSRTTAEAAYFQLCADGYIVSKPQSGYYVTDLYFRPPAKKPSAPAEQTPFVRYDFSSLSADPESFDFGLWKRYLKSALRQDARMLSYGEVQGEYDLRAAVAQYITEKRNVICTAENIVIGAGVQSLLHILCAILKEQHTIAFRDREFAQGMAIFRDHGFGITEKESKADVLYISPSHVNRHGDVMPTQARIALLKSAAEHGTLLIEDDYDNEFAYFGRPAPALQGLDGGQHVIYLGTFSRLLLPSIRLSFMVLPDGFLRRYREIAALYNQTASKAEQIALCQFIRDGHLASQIRKVRRLYEQKTADLEAAVRSIFGAQAKRISKTGFTVRANIQTPLSAAALIRLAAQKGIAVRAADAENGCLLFLSCSGVRSTEFQRALHILREISAG